MPGDDGTLHCLLTGSDYVVKSLPMTQETTATDPDDPSPRHPPPTASCGIARFLRGHLHRGAILHN